MSAVPKPGAPRLEPITIADLDTLLAIEVASYPVPWSRGNFVDSLAAGYLARKLLDRRRTWIGYFIAMAGVDEMHLLNLTVAPRLQRQGHGRWMLDALIEISRARRSEKLWLEVRAGNRAAQALYQGHGFVPVGLRKGYYPAPGGAREDAIVMSLVLKDSGDALE